MVITGRDAEAQKRDFIESLFGLSPDKLNLGLNQSQLFRSEMSTVRTTCRIMAFCGVLVSALALMSCSSDTTNPPTLTIPTEYPGADFTANTAQQSSILSNITTLTGTMQSGRTGAALNFATMSDQFAPLRPHSAVTFVSLADGFL